MAKKKHTHPHKSTNPLTKTPKMDEDQNPQNTENAPVDTNGAAIEENQAAQLSNLKSLNAQLLKETVENRQEISALLETKKSLETELTRSESEVDSVRAELTRVEAELRRVEQEKEAVEREMFAVAKARDEFGKKKCEGDVEIEGLKKVEIDLKGKIEKGNEELIEANREKVELKQGVAEKDEEVRKLRERLDEMAAKERSVVEELMELKLRYESVSKALEESERNVVGLMGECDGLKNEIEGLRGEKEVILKENDGLRNAKSEDEGRIREMDEEVKGLNVVVLSLRVDEEKWRSKFFELEKSNGEVEGDLEGLKSEMKAVLEEKKVKEVEIERMIGEKLSAFDKVSVLEKDLESVKREKEEIVEEKCRLEEVKSSHESEIKQLQCEVNDLRGNFLSLQESNEDQLERIRKLVSETDDRKSALDRVTVERDDVKKSLDEEKANGMKLQVKVSEISKKMEETAKEIEELRSASDTLSGQKKDIETRYNKLVEEKDCTEQKLVEAKEKTAELEGLLRSKNDMFESALALLRETALQLSKENEKKGDIEAIKVIGRSVNGAMEPYLAELEAIRAVFKSREVKVGEMQQQVETLQCSVLEARKKKCFWTMVSSATATLLAAAVVSFAYAARVR